MAVTATQLNQLYLAYFGRPADFDGLNFYLNQPAATLQSVAAAFSASPESVALYGTGFDAAQVNAIYQNLFNRDAEPAGITYWSNEVNSGRISPAFAAWAILNGAQNDDKLAVTNKLAITDAFTKALDTTPEIIGYANGAAAESARLFLKTVGSSAASLTAATTGLPAAVAAAVSIGSVVGGDTFTLTTAQNTVIGTAGNDIIKGIFGGASGDTVTAGDSVDGGNGNDTVELFANGVTPSTAAFETKNVETINIRDLFGGTFNAAEVKNGPAINFTETLVGQTSTVLSADLASTFGLSGKGNLTVDFLTTTGTADTAKVSLSSAGTSTAARSLVDVADGNTVEKATIAATGTNFITLKAGATAASVIITGNGTNNFDLTLGGSVAPVMNVDASASTGANTFVLGNTLNTSDVLKGGTGADTASVNFTGPTLVKPTFTSVETLTLDFDALAVLDLSGTTGTTTITLNGSSANQLIQKAGADVATLNVQSGTGVLDVTLNRATGLDANLTLNIGTTATTAAYFELNDVTLTGIKDLAINTVGTKNHDISGGIHVNDALGNLTVNVGADQYLYISGAGIEADGAIGNVTVDMASNAQFWTGVYGESVGNVAVNANARDASGGINVYAYNGDIGNITVKATGTDASAEVWAYASGTHDGADFVGGGNIGNISVTVNGNGAQASVGAEGTGIGNISLDVQGFNASGYVYVSAVHQSYSGAPDGNIGNITINVGEDAYAYANLNALSGGSIGTTAITVGLNAGGGASYMSQGGTIGAISATVANGGDVWLDFTSGNGAVSDVGNITATLGNNAHLDVNVSGNYQLGDITATFGTNGSFSGYWDSWQSGGVGNVDMTFGNGGNFDMFFSSGNTGDVGNITTKFADSGNFNFRHVSGFDGNIGNISATFGADGYFDFQAMSGGGTDMTIGATTLSFGAGGDFYWTVSGGDYSDIGLITVAGGSTGSSGYIYLGDTSDTVVDVFGGVDASAWLGEIYVELDAVTTGTIVRVGAAGSNVYGTEGADNIFMGAGVDTFHFDTTPTSVDTVFNFTGGASKDVLDVAVSSSLTATTHTVNPGATTVLANSSITKLVNITGGDDCFTAAGLKAALNGGEFGNLDTAGTGGTYTLLVAAGTGAAQFYVFTATDANDADIDFDTVALVGIVNMSGSSFSSLVAGNFS